MARTVTLVLAAVLALAGEAHAQDWPTRPVTMVVPFAAGGPVDTSARIMAARLAELLGQPVIIENVAGAGSMTGANRVAKAPPDGSVFLYGNSSTHTFSQLLYKAPLYDAVGDFAPVAAFVENSKVLIARRDFPADTLADFIAYVRTHQAKLQYGSAGAGSAAHVTCVLLNSAIGVEVTHIPYRGLAPALQDLIGGRIDYICEIISTALPQIRAKAVKALAILSPTRSRVLPDHPTADEQGLRASTSTPGMHSSFPRARRSRSSAASPARRAKRSTHRRCARASRTSG
jgi:putative tricarboxylic transport membrane protein